MMELKDLVKKFRDAIELAEKSGDFNSDISFKEFPRGCCGDASDLLAQFLLDNGITTWYVCGTHHPTGGTEEENFNGMQTHAWLTTSDPRMTSQYQIIDITGDQFQNDPEYYNYDKRTYIGPMDMFHKLFDFEYYDIHENKGISSLGCFAIGRLWKLYEIILKRF